MKWRWWKRWLSYRAENRRLREHIRKLSRVDLAVARTQIMELESQLRVMENQLAVLGDEIKLLESNAEMETLWTTVMRDEIKQQREDLIVSYGKEVTLHELIEKMQGTGTEKPIGILGEEE